MSMSDAMQQFLASLELPTGESLPVQDLPSVPDTTTPGQRIVMDPKSLQAFGNSVREMKKDSWGPDQMKEWDRFISAGSLEERVGIILINTLDVKELLGCTD